MAKQKVKFKLFNFKVDFLNALNEVPSSILESDIVFINDTTEIYSWGKYWNASEYIHPETHPASMITESTDKHFMTEAQINKLNGLTNYVHPSTHSAVMITESSNKHFMTDDQVTKLNGLVNYIHPLEHPPSIITQDSNNRFFTDDERIKLASIDPNASASMTPEEILAALLTVDSNTSTLNSDTLDGYHANNFATRIERVSLAWDAIATSFTLDWKKRYTFEYGCITNVTWNFISPLDSEDYEYWFKIWIGNANVIFTFTGCIQAYGNPTLTPNNQYEFNIKDGVVFSRLIR